MTTTQTMNAVNVRDLVAGMTVEPGVRKGHRDFEGQHQVVAVAKVGRRRAVTLSNGQTVETDGGTEWWVVG